MNQFCDKCGSQINQATGTCPNCTPTYAVVNNQPQKKEPKNKKYSTKEIVAVTVAIVLFFGLFSILGYVFGKLRNSLPDSYNEIIEEYKLVMSVEEDDEHKLSKKLINKIKNSYDYEISYSYIDINADDTKELVVGGSEKDSVNVEIYDIFTMDDNKNAVQLFDVGNFNDDTEIEIYNDVIKFSEENEEISHFEYLKLPEKQWEVKTYEEYLYEEEKYYEIYGEIKIEISEETFEEADQKHEGEEFDLEWVKIKMEEDKTQKITETTQETTESTTETTTETTTEITTETTTEKPKKSDAEIYQDYLKNGGMDKYVEYGNKNYYDIESCLVDLNNDGSSELLIAFTNKESLGVRGYAVSSVLLGLQNEKVVTIKEVEFGGGSGGGEYLHLKYDTQKQKYVVVKDGYSRDGYWCYVSFLEAYSYNGRTLIKYLDLESPGFDSTHVFYADTVEEYNAQTSFYTVEDDYYTYYKIDGQFVSETDYNKAEARFKDPTDSKYKMKKGTWSNPLAL